MNHLFWTDLAVETYTEIIEFHTENHGLEAAIAFDEKVEAVLNQLSLFANSCANHPLNKHIRICMITPKIGMLVFPRKKQVEILAFGSLSLLKASHFL